MQLTEKSRIYPTPEQEEVLWHLSEQCKLIYNFALAERRQEWELNNLRDSFQVFPWGKTKYEVNYKKQQNDLPALKEEYPRYSVVYSKVLQMVLRGLDGDYNSFLEQRVNGDKNVHPPGFKGKQYFTTKMYNQSGFKGARKLPARGVEMNCPFAIILSPRLDVIYHDVSSYRKKVFL